MVFVGLVGVRGRGPWRASHASGTGPWGVTTLHYTTLHYTTLHYTRLPSTAVPLGFEALQPIYLNPQIFFENIKIKKIGP